MKNLIRAVGALSLGAASLAVTNSAIAAEGGDKPWTASASLRGFYDDNIFTSAAAESSWGFDIAPSISYGRTVDNTSFEVAYAYTARWFENRTDAWDQVHDAKAGLTHKFSDRFRVGLSDNFISAQDPEQFQGVVNASPLLRANGNNIYNAANISGTVSLTEVLEAVIGYRNNLVDYDDPAFAGALNRVEHLPSLDLNYLWKPTTSVGIGYQFGIIDYDTVARSYDTHIIYAGARHTFNQNFMGSLNVGAQITDYDLGGNVEATPYLDARLSYLYAPASEISVAIKHTMNATDVLATANQETTLFQLRWNHAFTAKIHANAIGQFQSSEFNGGVLNGTTEDFWTLGGKITYILTPQVSLNLGYYHDTLTSFRGYQRNRVSLGATASF